MLFKTICVKCGDEIKSGDPFVIAGKMPGLYGRFLSRGITHAGNMYHKNCFLKLGKYKKEKNLKRK